MSDTNTSAFLAENAFANQANKITNTYGGSSSGSPTLGISGNYVKTLNLYSSSNYSPCAIEAIFDNDVTCLMGNTASSSSHISIDLSNDSIALMYIRVINNSNLFGSGSGLGGIYVETVQGNIYCTESMTPFTDPEYWQLLSDGDNALKNIVLTGIGGTSGDGIDSFYVYYKDDKLINQAITDVIYNNFQQDLAGTINIATATVSNSTDDVQEMSISFAEAVSATVSFETSLGIELGLTTKVQAGIPFVANGEVEVSASTTFTVSVGAEASIERSFGYDATVSVSANETIQATATASSYNITSDYSARFSEVWVHAGAVTRDITGTTSGTSAFEVTVDYTSIPASN